MASKLEKWDGAQGFTLPMITCVLSGTRNEVRWGLHYKVEAVKLQPCRAEERLPNLLRAPILKWLGHRKLNLTLLTLGPPTTSCLNIHPHHTTPPLYTDTQLTVATTRLIYIFWYGYRGWKSMGCSWTLRRVKKIQEGTWDQGEKMLVATASFIVSPSHGVVADVNRNKRCRLPILSLLTVSRITTAGALFWLLGSHGSR